MKNIYLDNAATTPIRQEVIDEMVKVMQSEYGNPSSTHSIGRSAKAIIETREKQLPNNCIVMHKKLFLLQQLPKPPIGF